MKDFKYVEPKTIDEACSLLAKHKGKAKIIAGGTDLLVEMKEKVISPQFVVNIKGIPNIDYIRYDNSEGLKIGSVATIYAIETSSAIKEKFGMLAEAAHKLGSVQVRNLATIGGNLCHAAPSAETAPALIGLGATVNIRGLAGERSILLEEFFKGPGENALQDDELLTEIQVPNPPFRTAGVYIKHSIRKAMDLAIVGVAVVITGDPTDGICSDVRIVLGAVAPIPMRAKEAEEKVRGKKVNDFLIEETAQTAAKESQPISDVRSSAEYRREMVKVLTKRAFRRAFELSKSA